MSLADIGFAARLGGDEFTVVLTGAESIADSVRAAGLRVIEAFHKPLSIGNRDLTISVSAGASIYPDHEHTAEGLLKAADAALFRAKALGRSQLSVYTPELLAEAATQIHDGTRAAAGSRARRVRAGISAGSERRHASRPRSSRRWSAGDCRMAGSLRPENFSRSPRNPASSRKSATGCCARRSRTAAEWHHGEWPEARVAINVSRTSIARPSLRRKGAGTLLREFELPARCIEIELTETVLQTGQATIDTLHRLHATGIAIALDDFGTGYSSLGVAREAAVHENQARQKSDRRHRHQRPIGGDRTRHHLAVP